VSAGLILGGAFALLLPTVLPVSFREDDAGYLAWARQADSIAECFAIPEGVLFGMFRPLVNVWWFLLFRVAGTDPFLYHSALGLLYAGSLLAFGFAASSIYGRGNGLLAAGLWLVVSWFLHYVVFWFSGYVYLLEILFLCLAVGFAARSLRGGARWPVAAAHMLTILAKEPAALILPAVYAGLVWGWPPSAGKRFRLWPLAAISVLGMLWVLLKPGLGGRLGITMALSTGEALEFLIERWLFYAGYLAAGPTKILWLGIGFGLARVVFRPPISHAHLLWVAAGLVTLSLSFFPGPGLFALGCVSLAWAVRDRAAAPGLLWFWVPLAAVLLVEFQTRTYLFEGSFGAALALSWAFRGAPALAVQWLSAARWRWVAGGVAAMLVLWAIYPVVAPKLTALRGVMAVRGNFSELVRELGRRLPEFRYVAIPDYSDTGLDYESEVLRAPDEKKAYLQKPMRPAELLMFLGVLGEEARPLHAGAVGGPVVLVLMNEHEVNWWEGTAAAEGIAWRPTFHVRRGGERAMLVHVEDAAGLASLLGDARR
jgi:hypothetical protein